jgi:GNAT superfamily N-acetyltransferase
MKIRDAGEDDLPDLLTIMDATMAWLVSLGRTGQWGSEPASASPSRVEHYRAYLRDHHARCAEIDGRPVGFCVVSEQLPSYVEPAGEPELYVRFLVTDRARKNTGIGAALVADAVAETRRRGLGLLRVDCYAGDDQKLVQQYVALGFTPAQPFTVERDGHPPWPGQVLAMRVPTASAG